MSITTHLKKYRYELFGGMLLLVALTIVFFEVLPPYKGLVAPDSPPFFLLAFRTSVWQDLLARGMFTIHTLYWLLFGGLLGHELTYILDTILLALGGRYYLRTQRLHPLAAWFGGLALALSGYTFTLFSAGHRGYFHMLGCAVWAFGLIAKGMETRRLIYFAWLGVALAWGSPHQPDVLLLVSALAVLYTLWRTRVLSRQSHTKLIKIITSIWPRFLVALATLLLVGHMGVYSAVTTQIANRDKQIEGFMKGGHHKAAEDTESVQDTHGRWLFATNWSLPPEDMLEFALPGVFGNDAMQPPYPYWGRLGQPHKTIFQKGRMMPNYRQHTVYLGMVSLIFALFAVLARVVDCRQRRTNHTAMSSLTNTSDLPFWCGAWLLCLLLAFGRFTPLYKLFYALPYMDYIRAPVKFLHLVEIATAFIAAMGMEYFLRPANERTRRALLWSALGFALFALITSLVTMSAREGIVKHVTELGLAQFADALASYAPRNALRSLIFAGLIAGTVWAALRYEKPRRLAIAACGICALAALDQTLVAKRYVRSLELKPFYHPNAVVTSLQSAAGRYIPTVVNYATRNEDYDWFNRALQLNAIHNLTPNQHDSQSAYGRIFMGLSQNPARLWQVLGAQAVIAPRKSIEPMVREGVLHPILHFELGNGVVRQLPQPSGHAFVVASLSHTLYQPRFVTTWQGSVPREQQIDAVMKGDLTVSDAPCVAGGTNSTPAKLEVHTVMGKPGAFSTRITVETEQPGLLIFDHRFDEQYEVLINHQHAPLYEAEGIWCAALVPEGQHEVVLRKRAHPWSVALSFASLAALIAAGLSSRRYRDDEPVV